MDTVDSSTRSKIMASVGQRNTGPEVKLRRMLHKRGLRYGLHSKKLPGSPDLVFPKFRAVIFVHGCFWHSHGCKYSTKPSTHKSFWLEKFNANKKRDKLKIKALLANGWRVLLVWECAVKGANKGDLEKVASLVVKWLKSGEKYGKVESLISRKRTSRI